MISSAIIETQMHGINQYIIDMSEVLLSKAKVEGVLLEVSEYIGVIAGV